SPNPEAPRKVSRRMIALVVVAMAVAAGAAYYALTSPKGPLAPYPGGGQRLGEDTPFPDRIATIRTNLDWPDRAPKGRLKRETLERSLELGTSFLLANQKPEGNFNYQYDFVEKTFDNDDNQVRQAGALWGIALIYRDRPSDALAAGLKKGFGFFFSVTRTTDDGRAYIAYPKESSCDTGTVALVSMAIIETLRSPAMTDAAERAALTDRLNAYLKFLVGQQRDDGRFSRSFNLITKMRSRSTSPYFDGEALLALTKAARYAGRDDLWPAIEKAACSTAEYYTVRAWAKDRDSDDTKGFYQWGSMAYREYVDADRPNAKTLEDTTLALAWWMTHTHRTLGRARNTSYAYEGLVSAYALAKRAGDDAAKRDIGYVIDKGLYDITAWQVEGPLVTKNRFLSAHRTKDSLAVGGVMNHRSEPPLRIDVTQHQMHAVLLALADFEFAP
ncbi:MAG: hypothetical protein IT350_05295, partial [Deltaproteobacteria bacterium]|nr:hypothetical protein [Deltaproteobacteria bacterium]